VQLQRRADLLLRDVSRVLRICVGVLRDATVLDKASKGSCPNIEPDRLGAGDR
jgi:hypothetical protein